MRQLSEAPTPRQLLDRGDVAKLAKLAIGDLERLLEIVAGEKERAKLHDDALTAALVTRFGRRAAATRRAQGRTHGIVRLTEDGFEIGCKLDKDVKWDQALLAIAVAGLSKLGLDPADYVTVEYKVSETKFAGWKGRVLGLFKKARTVKDRKPGFEIKPAKVEQWKEAAREAA